MGVLLIFIVFLGCNLRLALTATNKSTCFDYWYKIQSSRLDRFEFDSNVCNGETYSLGHQFEKFRNECSIEPPEEILSHENSVWTFYKCIVEKSLGEKPLTLTNYAEMMVGNMSETTKLSILSVLNKNSRETETDWMEFPNSTIVSELEKIKHYWKTYFDTEMTVCTDSENNTCTKYNMTDKSQMYTTRLFWAPEEHCSNGFIPKYRSYWNNQISSWNKIWECAKSLTKTENQSLANNSSDISKRVQSILCSGIVAGKFEIADVDKLIDFETIYYKDFIPEFYSQTVKQNVFNVTRKLFAKKFYNFNETILTSESVKDIVSYAAQHLEMKWKDQGKREEIWPLLTNADLITFFKHGLSWEVDPCYMDLKCDLKSKTVL